MKRLCLLLLLLAVPVHAARVAVLVPTNASDVPNTHDLCNQFPRLLTTLGIDHDVLGPGVGKTEWARVGAATFGTGAGAYTQTYAAAIILSLSATAAPPGTWRSDSMTRSVTVSSIIKMPTIPTIRIAAVGQPTQTTSDSNGCDDGQGGLWLQPYLGDCYVPGTSIRWAGVGTHTASPDYAATGGVRGLLGWTYSARGVDHGISAIPPNPCYFCDSLVAQVARPETAMVWVKWNTHVAGAGQSVYISDADAYGLNSEWTQYLLALAYVDSVVGGTIIKRPLRLAINIRGGWRRNGGATEGGFPTTDSAAVIALIDSIASLGIPFTVGVNLDSLENYTRDKEWWLRAAPYVSFAPENWALDSTKSLGAASWQRPRDLFGVWRKRIAFGDGTGLGADTSIASLTRATFYKMDSTFGRGMVDHVLIPPGNIWCPIQSNANSIDSLWSAFAYGGAKGIVLNEEWNGRQASARQMLLSSGTVPVRYSIGAGSRFKLLMTPGWQDSGAAATWGNADESARISGNSGMPYPFRIGDNFGRSWMGVPSSYQGGGAGSNDASPADTTYLGPCFVYTIHAGDLGSNGASPRTSWGWQQIRMLKNMADAINHYAYRDAAGKRKTVVSFVKLQDLEN